MKQYFNSLVDDFVMFLLAYKFGTDEKNGETTILATEEQIREEIKKIYKMIYKIGE